MFSADQGNIGSGSVMPVARRAARGGNLPRTPGLLEQVLAYSDEIAGHWLEALAEEIEVEELDLAEIGA